MIKASQAAISARARICDLVESEFVARVLPASLRRSDAGNVVRFGPLQGSQQGIATDDEVVPWPQIEQVEIGPERIVIRRKGRTSDWFRSYVPQVPNACLLKAVVDAVRARKPREERP